MSCQQCGECCRWIGFSYGKMPQVAIDFYETRGFKVVNRGHDIQTIYLPSVCPHLQEDNTCGIQDTKPEVCKNSRGDTNPITEKVCQWKN
jgi:Fe-S-cluster containining protein